MPTAETMSFLVEKILELASHRSEEPNPNQEEDIVDLGLESFDEDPNTSTDSRSGKYRLAGASYSNAEQSKRLMRFTSNDPNNRPPNSCAC